MADFWTKNDSVFVCDSNGFVVAPSGTTVCIGPVDKNGDPIKENQDNVLNNLLDDSALEKGVSKIKSEGYITGDLSNGNYETEKRGRGRPRKTGDDVSRITKWRREKQGVLI